MWVASFHPRPRVSIPEDEDEDEVDGGGEQEGKVRPHSVTGNIIRVFGSFGRSHETPTEQCQSYTWSSARPSPPVWQKLSEGG